MAYLKTKMIEISELYWELAKIILPVVLAAQILVEIGVLHWASPFFEPLMQLFGLPPELAFAWLTGVIAGLWAGIVVLFVVVSPADLNIGEVSIYSSLLLFAHALPIEQRIIQRAGPGIWITTFFRLFGGALYAWLVALSIRGIEKFSQPVSPLWIPTSEASGFAGFLVTTAETFFWMLLILAALVLILDGLKASGLINLLQKLLLPVFKPAGIKKEASPLLAIGILLGITYGGGLLIKEAKSGVISERQVFLSCVFMGFAHSLIEDTLVVLAIGADISIVLWGRLFFAVLMTGLIAVLLQFIPQKSFSRYLFNSKIIAS